MSHRNSTHVSFITTQSNQNSRKFQEMENFKGNLVKVKQWMEAFTRPTLYRIGWKLNEMTFENVTQMDQLLQFIYDAATIPSLAQRQLHAAIC